MSAPLIWIGAPALAGLLFWFFRRSAGRVVLLSMALCLLLAGMAWLIPLGQPVRIGPLAFTIDTTFAFVGRRLVLDQGDRLLLIFIFGSCTFWFAGAYAARANHLLVPFGLGVIALLVAALAVQPFLYAALLVEMAVLLSVPILAPPGRPIGQGVLRYLIFQTLAMPFILLAGWALGGVEQNPASATLVTLSTVFLALGFAFWLAVFPFYTWIPLLAEQADPYVSGFIFLFLPTVDLMLAISYIDRFGWLRASSGIYEVIGLAGTVMIITAGIWAAFQKDLSRLLGYGVIVETGYSLLAISLSGSLGKDVFSSMFLPRTIGVGLWALSLSIILRESGSTRFENVQGLAQRLPFATAGLAVASLTLGGLPILAVFPIHQVVLEQLAARSLLSALWVLVGSGCMLFSTFRSLAVLTRGIHFSQVFAESRLQAGLLVAGIAGLLLIGILPQVFLQAFHGLLVSFTLAP